ncbi:MAG: AI-2E family transporter [Alphaproteobacteria bacterium]|nr:AI-2E family transporter [Alphaproteobacteria bacterium]
MTDEVVPGYDERDVSRRTEEAQEQVARTHGDTRSVSLLVLAILGVLYTLYLAQDIILPIVLAIVLNLLLQPARRFLTGRLRVPAALASLLLILALFAVVSGLAAAVSLPASTWITRAPEALPKLQQKLGPLQGPIRYIQEGVQKVEQMMEPSPGPSQGQAQGENQGQNGGDQAKTVTVRQSSGLGSVGLSVLNGTRAFLSKFFTIVVILFFLLWAGDTLLRSFVEIMPRFGEKRRVVEISSEIEDNISGYLATITMMNALVGVANGLSTWACGLPDPLLWGTLAFLLNYIPILGPFTGVVVFFIVGVFTYSTIWWALLPAGIYLLIHVIEGETVTPMLLASRFTLNPVLVILSLFVWDWMWGVIGALLAVPLLAITKIVCDHIPRLTPLGHMIGGSRKGRDAAST